MLFANAGSAQRATSCGSQENSLGLTAGSKVTVEFGGKQYFCKVDLRKNRIGNPTDRDNILLPKKLGEAVGVGTYWKGSEIRYKAHLALSSAKSRWSLGGTVLTLAGAVLTALHASSSCLAERPAHFDTTAWALFACTGFGACFYWYKDNLA